MLLRPERGPGAGGGVLLHEKSLRTSEIWAKLGLFPGVKAQHLRSRLSVSPGMLFSPVVRL